MVKFRSCYKLIQWFVILSAASTSNSVTNTEAFLAKKYGLLFWTTGESIQLLFCLIAVRVSSPVQCRNKDNVSGGARGRRRREPLGGSVGMLPQKILKSRGLEMLFPAFSKSYLWFTHNTNYLLRTLSQQTNAHWEYNTWNVIYKIENRLSLYLETSKCFTFQSHRSKFVVNCLSCLKGKRRLHRRSFFENFPNSCLHR